MGNQPAQFLPRTSVVPGPADQATMEATLRHAHVHVYRYFRAWLSGVPGGATLADGLAEEALFRIARAFRLHETCPDEEQIVAWLAVAWEVARELNG